MPVYTTSEGIRVPIQAGHDGEFAQLHLEQGLTGLAGGSAVAVTGSAGVAIVGFVRSTTIINGTLFSTHALKQMAARGVPPSAVKGAVDNGTRSFQALNTKMMFKVLGGGAPGQAGLEVVKGTFTRRIVTVMKRGRNYLKDLLDE